MAKNKGGGGKVPQKVLDQRANAARSTSGNDPDEILKRLEAEEAEAYERFQAEQRERREQALAAVVQPLRDERNRLAQVVNDSNTRIGELDRQIAKLLGKAEPKGRAGAAEGGRKRRPRMSQDDKLRVAKVAYQMLKDAGEPLAASKLEQATEGVKMRELREIWNKANPSQKIERSGDKATTRYHL